MCVLAADRETIWTNNRRHADEFWGANKERVANALIGVLVAVSSNSADDTFTSFFTPSTYADVGLFARICNRAEISGTSSSWERIARETFQTFTSRSRSSRDALSSRSANHTFAN
jgi:hypothetical protein